MNKSFNRRKPVDIGTANGARAMSLKAQQKAQAYASNLRFKRITTAKVSNAHMPSDGNPLLPPPLEINKTTESIS